jgi:hypothetical protein
LAHPFVRLTVLLLSSRAALSAPLAIFPSHIRFATYVVAFVLWPQ